ncbi:hypothetical protein Back11_38680 [Paenibacillus baekrokdamisoli]|uniref:Uncharacterized protein n=2 Tax=Paenibacillus baekrokdamisoli TaxID=1712516 RepID=A0A3G9JC75_9BACL|nr:S-layer homology domain-containing protein [Paenibacillus baekrokdamisoli]BBH22523.1 hypothetical protein Back11_38680 [Paenibacillus baekrokdamisoli]
MIKRSISVLTVLFLVAGLIPTFAAAAALSNWNTVSPKVTGEYLSSVTFANGMFMAVGGNVDEVGTILTSSDGVNWTRRTSGTNQRLDDVTFGNNTYVAVGTNGAIVTSTDAETWTSRDSNTTDLPIFGVTYGNGTFVAVGHSGSYGGSAYISTSADGKNWTKRTSGTSKFLFDVAYGNGVFVTVGSNGVLLTSADGTTWTSRTPGTTEYLNGVTYDGGKFVAVGDSGTILTSANGTSWTNRTSGTSSDLEGVTSGNGTLVATGRDGVILTSADGAAWTSRTSGSYTVLTDVAYGNGMFMTVGASGTILTSADGASWTSLSITNEYLTGVAYGNEKYVAVGNNGQVLTSTNGASWTRQITDTRKLLNMAAYGNGKFVAVGGEGAILTSADGTSWTSATSGTTNYLYSVAFGDGKFVAVGSSGTLLTSADGQSWTSQTGGGYNMMSGIAYGSGTFVAVGSGGMSGVVLTSTDGASWTSRTSGTTNSLNKIVYDGGKFVAVGSNGTILTSADGASWTSVTSGTTQYLYSIAYGDGLFVAVTSDKTMPIVTSTDGASWTSVPLVTTAGFSSVAYGNGMFVAVGFSGTISFAETIADAASNRASASPGRVLEGGSVTLTATGDRQSATGGGNGAARFVPISWTSTESGKSGSFSLSGGIYSSTYTTTAAGSYTVTATFAKQTWDGSAWVDAGTTDTKTTTVAVFGQNAAAPTIGTQPEDQTAIVGGTSPVLAVAATSSDGGTLSYQWYSNTTNSNIDGTAISNATNASYEAPTATTGTMYYYVIVTNTNSSAIGSQTATAKSSAAKITVNEALTYTISAIADQTATALTQGYESGSQETTTIQVTNSGTGHLTNLSATLSGTNVNDFVITQPTATLNSGAPATSFTVQAKDGLPAGTYTATITVSASQMTDVTFKVTQTVNLPNAPGNPQNLLATGGDRQVSLKWSAVTGATYYNLYMSNVPNQFSDDEMTSVTDVTYNVDNLLNGTTYYFMVKAGGLGGLSAESNQASATPATAPAAPTGVTAAAGNGQATITFTAPTDNGGSAITGYEVTASPGNAVITGMTSPITLTGLTNGTSYTFTVKAINGKGSSESSTVSNAVIPSSPSSGNTPSGSTTTTPGTTITGVDILVNGKVESAGTATTTKQNGQTVTTVVLDQKKLDDRLAAVGQHAVVTIPVNAKSDVVVGELNGQIVKNMEDKQAVLVIQTDKATYTLPAHQINIRALSDQVGKSVALQDIKVQIEIAAPTADTVKVVENAAAKGTFTLVTPPVEFTVSATHGGTTVKVENFNAYVERTIAIPDGVDPNNITTAVVVDPDGTVRHVPTKIELIDGKYYAKVNSLTNSTYSVVWHPLEFNDVANHWAKNAVNDMGSRMIISGNGNGQFSPDRNVTRAEFAAIIVRGLGLKLENAATPFSDVKTADWYSSAINTAYAHHLINGFADGTFRPNDNITREQAMVMIAKAMTITELKSKLPVQSADATLRPYADTADASNWALSSIADSVQAGVVSGRTSSQLAPKAYMTRAEVATIIQKLLQKSGLI